MRASPPPTAPPWPSNRPKRARRCSSPSAPFRRAPPVAFSCPRASTAAPPSLAAVVPGDRAIKVAAYTLPPGSTLTTDVTRIVPVTPGSLVKIDFGVRVPAPEAPLARPQVSMVLPELRPGDAGGLIYRLAGIV